MSTISNTPTGVQNIEDGPLDVVVVPSVAGIEYQHGDIIVLGGPGGTEGDDLTNAYPVQALTADTISNLQTAISSYFLGISNGYIAALNTRTDNKLPIATRGRVRLDITDATFLPIGTLVAVATESDGAGAYIPLARTVESTATDSKAIGRLVAPKAAADTTALVEFRGHITTGPQT
ncbi:MAG: hypothetical protein WC479_08980 [Candidatus Izemoplasmatales bacterium]|jgi:hypothetical protein